MPQRLLHCADDLISGLEHVLDDMDRIDAHVARSRISNGFDQSGACRQEPAAADEVTTSDIGRHCRGVKAFRRA